MIFGKVSPFGFSPFTPDAGAGQGSILAGAKDKNGKIDQIFHKKAVAKR